MGFLAKRFSFDGIPCEKYGLRIFDMNGAANSAAPFVSTGNLITDVIPNTGRNLLYGRSYDSPLEFNLVFGVNPNPKFFNMNDFLDRYEMDVIADWLTSPTSYKWLDIEQPDLEMIRYHCIISQLEPVQIAWLPWAFTAKITCDSPYGYLFPKTYSYSVTDSSTISIINYSTLDKLYYPKIKIVLNGGNSISITNQSCDDITFELTNLPVSSNLTINVDGQLGIIESSNLTYSNLYQYCNFNWLPLKKGKNVISISGNCSITFECEFPVNVGG